MKVLCLFKVTSVSPPADPSPNRAVDPNQVSKIVLDAIYDPSKPEEMRFAKATPSGRMELQVDNPDALPLFKLGESVSVLFEREPGAGEGYRERSRAFESEQPE